MRISLCSFLIVVLFTTAGAYDYAPAPPQDKPILLRGGDLYTVSGGVLKGTDLLFDRGRITQIGRQLVPPDNTQVVDITGRRVYPGLIAPYTVIGLIEIGEVRATNDLSEVGRINPNVQAHTAYNPDSEIIPTVRSNGITTALVVPRGNLVMGRSSLINLDGWTVEDAAEKLDVALHVRWPQVAVVDYWWVEKTPEEQRREMAENRKKIFQIFDDARAYYLARQADPDIEIDLRWEAMLPVMSGDMPVVILANDYRQIEQAVSFANEYGLKMILAGGADSWMLTDLLEEHDIAVIVRRTQTLPMREDEGFDQAYRLPAMLANAGVRFCISSMSSEGGSATTVRNLPLQVGQAIAYGLSSDEALRAVTLSTAEILGVADDLGSLEPGKKATLIVAEGDIFDQKTHRVVMEFIEGRQINLDNKHRELYRKFRQKRYQPQSGR